MVSETAKAVVIMISSTFSALTVIKSRPSGGLPGCAVVRLPIWAKIQAIA
jgi:hypothetical protein